MPIKIINHLPNELFIIKSERTIQKKYIKNELFQKDNKVRTKFREFLYKMYLSNYVENKKQVDNNKVSIIESDALGMTIIDDNLNDENSE